MDQGGQQDSLRLLTITKQHGELLPRSKVAPGVGRGIHSQRHTHTQRERERERFFVYVIILEHSSGCSFDYKSVIKHPDWTGLCLLLKHEILSYQMLLCHVIREFMCKEFNFDLNFCQINQLNV